MANGAHGAINSKIAQNELNPKNIKNKVESETLDLYGLFDSANLFNMGTAVFNAQTKGGDNRFYKRNFSMPSMMSHIAQKTKLCNCFQIQYESLLMILHQLKILKISIN